MYVIETIYKTTLQIVNFSMFAHFGCSKETFVTNVTLVWWLMRLKVFLELKAGYKCHWTSSAHVQSYVLLIIVTFQMHLHATGLCKTYDNISNQSVELPRKTKSSFLPLLQMLQTYGRSPVCVLMCTLSVEDPLNPLWHSLHK